MLHIIKYLEAKMPPKDHGHILLIMAIIYSYEPNASQLSLTFLKET